MTPLAHERIAEFAGTADDFWNEIVGVINGTPGFDWRRIETIRKRLEAMRTEDLELPSEEIAREVFGLEYGIEQHTAMRGLILAYRYRLLATQLVKAVLQ